MRRILIVCLVSLAICLLVLPKAACGQFSSDDANYVSVVQPPAFVSPYPGYAVIGAPAVADFNKDGHPDIAVAIDNDQYEEGFTILLGNGMGSFRQQNFIPLPNNPCRANLCPGLMNLLFAEDFNGDGNPDVLFYSSVTESSGAYNTQVGIAFLYLGNGDGTFKPPVDISKWVGNNGLTVTSLRQNNRLDLITQNLEYLEYGVDDGPVVVSLGEGNGTFKPPIGYDLYPFSNLVVGDLGNGHPDIFSLDSSASYSVLFGDGTGEFGQPVTYPIQIASGTDFYGNLTLSAAGHFVRNKPLGIVFSGQDLIQIFNGNGDGTLQPGILLPDVTLPNGDPLYILHVSTGDINGDGVDDIVFTGYDSPGLTGGEGGPYYLGWILSHGDGTFGPPEYVEMNGSPASACTFQGDPAFTLADTTGSHRLDAIPTLSDVQNLGLLSACVSVFFNTANLQVGTSTTLTSTASPVLYSNQITLQALVDPSSPAKGGGPATPSGSVSLYNNGTLLGSRVLASGAASFAGLTLPVGSYNLTAVYSGGSYYFASTAAPMTQVVSAIPTAISLTSSANPVSHTSSVTFTAVITAPAEPFGKLPNSASGVGIYFYDGSKLITSRAVDASGKATLTVTLPAGTHSISVKYLGNSYWTPSTSNIVTEKVN